jgi:hypothetical protein
MPRGPGGIYNLPAGNPVVPGTVIESEWANPTMEDIKNEISDSLSRTGKGGMLAALRGPDGSEAVPTFSFTNEPSSGRYRDGPGQIVESVQGNKVVRYVSSGLEQWDSTLNGGLGDWVPLTPRDALGTPFEPASSNLDATNVQDAIQEVNDKTGGAIEADSVLYDYARVPVYFVAPTVQLAIDRIGTDIPGLANDIIDNADAIAILDIDIGLLQGRVTTNETNIGNISNDTQINTDTINNELRPDITTNRDDISSIKLEQITQNSDIAGNFDYIDAVYAITQDNADDIVVNGQGIATNAADISTNFDYIVDLYSRSDAVNLRVDSNDTDIFNIQQKNIAQDGEIAGHESRITQNTSDIIFVYGIADGNTTDISNLTGRVNTNETDISVNQQDLAAFGSIFPNGFLLVANGGSGTTQRTGTGALVAQSNPSLVAAYLDSGSTSYTQSTGTNNATVASTAFVKNQGYGTGDGNASMSHVNNAGASYMAVRRTDTGDRWQVTQWGRRTFGPAPGTKATFAISYINTDYDVSIAPYVAGDQGINTAPGIETRQTSGIYGISPNYLCGYVAVGEVAYSALFAAIPLSSDRFYNKVEQTEHIEQIHGPWGDNPDVVILPPGNTYWGSPLDPDEDLTYDIDNLPLARVARVKPVGELITNILLPSGLSQGALSRALLADSRGNPAPLIAFNAALDILIGANPYTEAQFLENL